MKRLIAKIYVGICFLSTAFVLHDQLKVQGRNRILRPFSLVLVIMTLNELTFLLFFTRLCAVQKDEALLAKAVPCGIFMGRKVLLSRCLRTLEPIPMFCFVTLCISY